MFDKYCKKTIQTGKDLFQYLPERSKNIILSGHKLMLSTNVNRYEHYGAAVFVGVAVTVYFGKYFHDLAQNEQSQNELFNQIEHLENQSDLTDKSIKKLSGGILLRKAKIDHLQSCKEKRIEKLHQQWFWNEETITANSYEIDVEVDMLLLKIKHDQEEILALKAYRDELNTKMTELFESNNLPLSRTGSEKLSSISAKT